MNFIIDTKPATTELQKTIWFLFKEDRIMMIETETGVRLPFFEDLPGMDISSTDRNYLGTLDGHPCYTASPDTEESVCADRDFYGFRELFSKIEVSLTFVIGRALQIHTWDINNRYCGKCGTATESKENDRVKECPECGTLSYPHAYPAVMMAVVKDKQILLGNSVGLPPGFYSVLAGYVEPGETLEACVKREIKEEVSLEIKNIRYFGSQPFAPTNSLMLAFTAEYAGGEISIDETEINEAAWFDADKLPEKIPPPFSVAGQLIEWFVKNQG
ncbi:MAG: NAD(+) diphosphatase [bacterium]|nr:NAD(+) diphosphatase [bacterium]